MILNELKLRNFCLYHGEQTFNLTPFKSPGKIAPVVLFGGINGGGKTTLLDAVQLVLYGIKAKCSNRNNKPYDEFLRESIHHGVDQSEGSSIDLSFYYATEGSEYLYEVSRSWSDIGGRIRERVRVHHNGLIDHWLSDNWSQIVEELIPFGVAQLCFFDAEKIRFLAEDETSTQALGGAIKSLLGLDLAERLVADAFFLEGRIANRAKDSTDLQEVKRLEIVLENLQKEISGLVQERAALENPRQAAEEKLRKSEEQFSKIGGKHWEKREAFQKILVEVEQRVHVAEEQLVTLASSELPLTLVSNLLKRVFEQSTNEGEAVEAEIVAILLEERDSKLLNNLKRKRISAKTIEIVEKLLEEDRAARSTEDRIEIRLRLSQNGRGMLSNLMETGLRNCCDTASGLISKVENNRKELEDLQRSMSAMPDEEAVREIAQELKESSMELASLEQTASRIEKQLEAKRYEKKELLNRIQKLRRKVVDEEIKNEEDARLGKLLVRTQETMNEFLRRATLSKIDRLSELVGESFRFLLRKKSLVERVLIDPDTFAITLYNNHGEAVPKQRLSEGEKQIFAISVLWGLSRASARPLPAIIDTPMARLDVKHRNKLVERYFPHASHQVIILSTDTEIERQYFHELEPFIARAYHLSYNENEKSTTAEEGYFWDRAVPDGKICEVTV